MTGFCESLSASECREWLIHFSTAVLHGVLPAVPYVHHLLLVSSMGLLSKDGIKVEDIDRAESMLMLYCKMYPGIYGKQIFSRVLKFS